MTQDILNAEYATNLSFAFASGIAAGFAFGLFMYIELTNWRNGHYV
jgi:hypothetical protein